MGSVAIDVRGFCVSGHVGYFRLTCERDRFIPASAPDGFAVDDEGVHHQLGSGAARLGAFRPV